MLTDCPLGWGHEPRLLPRVLDTAVNSLFWSLYEVVDGRYRLAHTTLLERCEAAPTRMGDAR